jgi:hypothetical protein
MAQTKPQKLQLKMTDEQLQVLRPLLQQTGSLKIAGEIEGGSLHVSFLACNAAFLACNAAFSVKGSGL